MATIALPSRGKEGGRGTGVMFATIKSSIVKLPKPGILLGDGLENCTSSTPKKFKEMSVGCESEATAKVEYSRLPS